MKKMMLKIAASVGLVFLFILYFCKIINSVALAVLVALIIIGFWAIQKNQK